MEYDHECANRHTYKSEDAEPGECPYCKAADSFKRQKTQSFYSQEGDAAAGATSIHAPEGAAAQAGKVPVGGARSKTISAYGDLGAPVVGWLVSVIGSDVGRDFRITVGRNLIGRDPACAVYISGDQAVSARQAFLTFEPRSKRFSLSPGDGSALTYVNGDELLAPRALVAFDRIETGHTTLMFVPFCGDQFAWPL